MKVKELAQIKHDEITYVLGADIDEVILYGEDIEIPSPWFYVTTKSSKKRRENWVNKHDAHFNLIKINNPISLYRKIYKVYDDFLSKYKYVLIISHDDESEKRENIYIRALEKMGFRLLYTHFHSEIKRNYILMSKQKLNVKKIMIKNIFETLS